MALNRLEPERTSREGLRELLGDETVPMISKIVGLEYAARLYGIGDTHPLMKQVARWFPAPMQLDTGGVKLARLCDAYTSAAVFNPTDQVFECSLYARNTLTQEMLLIAPVQSIVPGYQVFELFSNSFPSCALMFQEMWLCFRKELTGESTDDVMHLRVTLRGCEYDLVSREHLIRYGTCLLLSRDASKVFMIHEGMVTHMDDLNESASYA
jgi:hypothetical protein